MKNEKRFCFWIIVTALLHGLLCWLLSAGLTTADATLARHHYWSLLVWFPLVRGATLAILPALAVGFALGHKQGIYKPLATIPLGVVAYWAYQWWFHALPWFIELRYLYVPCILLSACFARWGYRLSARESSANPDATLEDGSAPEASPFGNRWKWATILVLVAILLAHAWRYMPHLEDDALISLRYAARLLAGHGLTWTDGPPVEGYSNLLWILATASLGALGIDLVTALRILGCTCMAAVIVAVVQLKSFASNTPSLSVLSALTTLPASADPPAT